MKKSQKKWFNPLILTSRTERPMNRDHIDANGPMGASHAPIYHSAPPIFSIENRIDSLSLSYSMSLSNTSNNINKRTFFVLSNMLNSTYSCTVKSESIP